MPASDAQSDRAQRAAASGRLAEQLVAQWLRQQNWQILAQRWHCRWGELDLIALQPETGLAFVEVKARSSRNWDANGLLAVPPRKQEKLGLAAQMFLATHPDYASLPCRFDVAVVRVQAGAKAAETHPSPIQIGKSVIRQDCALILLHYCVAAFEVNA